jgi:predicted alpha/beta hydrolase
MGSSPQRRSLTVRASDGAQVRVQMHLPQKPRAMLYWLPALGVGIGPNETFADALAADGIAVGLHEWRGLGQSDRRASRRCDWGYRELLDLDVPAGLNAMHAELGDLPRWMAGHSLGGQLALIHAARRSADFEGVLLVASGQPHWRAFPGVGAAAVLAFACVMPGITALAGHFPGALLRFAGREASQLMRDWAGTALRGNYQVRAFGDELDRALTNYRGAVLALRMREDKMAPPGAIERLRSLAPNANWTVLDFGREAFAARRPDHFGWLREPGAVTRAFANWSGVIRETNIESSRALSA